MRLVQITIPSAGVVFHTDYLARLSRDFFGRIVIHDLVTRRYFSPHESSTEKTKMLSARGLLTHRKTQMLRPSADVNRTPNERFRRRHISNR